MFLLRMSSRGPKSLEKVPLSSVKHTIALVALIEAALKSFVKSARSPKYDPG